MCQTEQLDFKSITTETQRKDQSKLGKTQPKKDSPHCNRHQSGLLHATVPAQSAPKPINSVSNKWGLHTSEFAYTSFLFLEDDTRLDRG